ncbi:MAG: YceI family protein [Anaerolineae bacterium]
MDPLENKSLIDRLFDWWSRLAPAGKAVTLSLVAIWLIFLGWLPIAQGNALVRNAVISVNEDLEVDTENITEGVDDRVTAVEESGSDPISGATRFEIVPEQSVASYSAVETFFGDSGLIVGRNTNQGLNTAVGETRGLTGSFLLDMGKGSPKIIGGEFSADLQQLVSVQPHRDDMLTRFWLESNNFPTATFLITEMPTLPPNYKAGTPAAFPLTGILTVRNIEKEVTFDVVASLNTAGDRLEAVAVANLLFEDFDISPPSMAGVLKVEPEFKLIVAIVAER